jgi:S-DNA-T family DNA segregation ATPase FtsK/SpoIIIE
VDEILERGIEGKANEAFDQGRARLIEETLAMFGAPARVVEVNRGPTITQFGVEPDFIDMRGGRRTKVKVSKIAALVDDLALALAAPSIRIEAPVPGKGYVGIEVPNPEISLVSLRDVMEAERFQSIPTNLRLGLGQDVSGRAVAADLTEMPHLLVAGTTGSGKSVCVNAIVACLLLQNTPEDLRLVMIDPKRVELTYYNGIPHLLAPVVVELEKVVPALQWVSREMDQRYKTFSKQGVRNIRDYNQRMQAIDQSGMHNIVVVIDELADLMMMAPDETERVITRLAQLARATGIHLIIATQRPSVDVVTGLIKANFPARIAFAVASSVDSRVIIDQPGAERLLGKGDMLFQAPDAAAPLRMQGSYVSEGELSRLIRFWKNQALGGESTEPAAPTTPEPERIPTGSHLEQGALWETEELEVEARDELYQEAVAIVREMRRASITLLQRRLRIGYTRSARLIDQLEEAGVIGPAKGGSTPREVLDYGELSPVGED